MSAQGPGPSEQCAAPSILAQEPLLEPGAEPQVQSRTLARAPATGSVKDTFLSLGLGHRHL